MFKKRFLAVVIVFAILLSFSVFAQDGTLAGIAEENPAYIGYHACVDSCENCADNCRFNAYRMAAEIESNEELCKQLPENLKNMCLNRVYATKASAAKASSLCEKISLEQEKSMCLLNVQIEKAISSKDETECNSAPEGLENACAYAYRMRAALENGNAPYCEKISEEALMASCNAAENKKQCHYKSTRNIYKIPLIILLFALILIIAIAARKKFQEKTGKTKLVRNKRV